MVENNLEIYQARFKRRAKDNLEGRELNLQDCDIRYVVAASQGDAQISADRMRKDIEDQLNTKSARYIYFVKTISVRPIHIEGHRILVEKIASQASANR